MDLNMPSPEVSTEVWASGMRRPETLSGEIWGILAFFNPQGYDNKLRHFLRCAESVRRQGLRLAAVEGCMTNVAPSIPANAVDILIRVSCPAVMWQKERLLNVALASLPNSCDKVVWLDGDVLFGNEDWVAQTTSALQDFVVVQPFELGCRLPPGVLEPSAACSPEYDCREGMASFRQRHQSPGLKSNSGFAWAARRRILDLTGLYDACIVGGADAVMAVAMYADASSPFFNAWLDRFCTPSHKQHILRWAAVFHTHVGGSVCSVPGTVFHLWHGGRQDRQYQQRHQILLAENYDPGTDIAVGAGGCWEWATAKHALHARLAQYFCARNECP